MIKGLDGVLISSENPKALAEFYINQVGMEKIEEFVMGDDGETAYNLKLGSIGIGIMPHSEIHGHNTQPARIMLNLEVDDEEVEVNRLKEAGVKVIADTYHVEGYGLVTTFEDVDGNYFQLVQVKAS